jgi:hypothetical protein
MRARARGVAEKLAGGSSILVDGRANSFGLESRGRLQIRGNGCLALGDARLAFAMWLPQRKLVIDHSRIEAVDAVDSHLGRRIGRPLLRVRFEANSGTADSGAWFVRDLARWLATLSRALYAGVIPRP